MTDRVGQQLGNYRILRLIGQGGFADVYLAEHLHLGMQAAIKVLSMRLAQENMEQFREEARTIARLVHPHIVRVLDFGFEDNIPYFVMDYAPNGSLRKLHPKGTRLPLEIVVTYVKQMADALQFAHEQRIIHRDVKPENMLVGVRNTLLLSDFGIAVMAQSSRYQNVQDMAGTIAYMAPEQIQAHPRTASDQYSLGVVAYEWLSGERPFQGTIVEIAGKHAIVPPPPFSGKVSGISPEVEQVVFKALAKDPKQRYENVQAFATALEYVAQKSTSQFTLNTLLVNESVQREQKFPPSPLSIPIHSPSPSSQADSIPHEESPRLVFVKPLTFQTIPPRKTSVEPTFIEPGVLGKHSQRVSLVSKREKRRINRRNIFALLAGGVVAAGVVGVSGISLFQLLRLLGDSIKQNAGGLNQESNLTLIVSPTSTSDLTSTVSPTSTPTQVAHTETVIGHTNQQMNTAQAFNNPADGQGSLLIRLPGGKFVAYEQACTHEGVTVNYDPNTHTLICPAHGAIFDPANGAQVLQGPATKPLASVTIKVNTDGTITVGG